MAVFLAPALTLVPKSVLFGIFLYMGVSAMAGIQFLDRVILVFMPVKHHPNVPYVKKVKIFLLNYSNFKCNKSLNFEYYFIDYFLYIFV